MVYIKFNLISTVTIITLSISLSNCTINKRTTIVNSGYSAKDVYKDWVDESNETYYGGKFKHKDHLNDYKSFDPSPKYKDKVNKELKKRDQFWKLEVKKREQLRRSFDSELVPQKSIRELYIENEKRNWRYFQNQREIDRQKFLENQ